MSTMPTQPTQPKGLQPRGLSSVKTTPTLKPADGRDPKRSTKTMPAPSRNPNVGQRSQQPQLVGKAAPSALRDPRGYAQDPNEWEHNDPTSQTSRESTVRGLRSAGAGLGGGAALAGAGVAADKVGNQASRVGARRGERAAWGRVDPDRARRAARMQRGADRANNAARGMWNAGTKAKWGGLGLAAAGTMNANRHLRRAENLDDELPDGVLPEDVFSDRVGKASTDVTNYYGNGTERGSAETTRSRRTRSRGESRGAQSTTNVRNSKVPPGVRRLAGTKGARTAGAIAGAGAIGAGYTAWGGAVGEKQGRRQAKEDGRDVIRSRREEGMAKALEDKGRFDRSDIGAAASGGLGGGIVALEGNRARRIGNGFNAAADQNEAASMKMGREALRAKNAADSTSGLTAADLRGAADSNMDAAMRARKTIPQYRKWGNRLTRAGKPMMAFGAAMPAATIYGNQRAKRAYNEQAAIEREKLGIGQASVGKAYRQMDVQINSNIPSGSRRGRRVTG